MHVPFGEECFLTHAAIEYSNIHMSIDMNLQVFALTKPFAAAKWTFIGFITLVTFQMRVESSSTFQDFIATFKGAWELPIGFSPFSSVSSYEVTGLKIRNY